MRAFSLLLVSVLAFASACSSPCMRVQQLICECRFQTSDERRNCESNAESQQGLDPPTDEELAVCEALVPGCEAILAGGDCSALDTDEGKRACGLAR